MDFKTLTSVGRNIVGILALGLVSCSSIMGQCIREDIAAMFGQFQMGAAQLGARLLRMNKEKDWLVVPPLHVQAPELVHA